MFSSRLMFAFFLAGASATTYVVQKSCTKGTVKETQTQDTLMIPDECEQIFSKVNGVFTSTSSRKMRCNADTTVVITDYSSSIDCSGEGAEQSAEDAENSPSSCGRVCEDRSLAMKLQKYDGVDCQAKSTGPSAGILLGDACTPTGTGSRKMSCGDAKLEMWTYTSKDCSGTPNVQAGAPMAECQNFPDKSQSQKLTVASGTCSAKSATVDDPSGDSRVMPTSWLFATAMVFSLHATLA